MTDVSTTADPSRAVARRGFLHRLGRPGVLFGAGLVTYVAAVMVLTGWIGMHRDAWYADWVCGAGFGASPSLRLALALVAVLGLLTLTAATFLLAFGVRRRRTAVLLFWLAVTLVWVVLVVVVLAASGYIADGCLTIRAGEL